MGNNKTLKGGKFIASGSYGCVYRPSLLCKNKKIKRSTAKVSKLMEKTEMIKEYDEYKKIDKIDPSYKFHLPIYDICEYPEKPDIKYDNKFSECRHYKNNLKDLAFINIEDGGVSLYDYLRKYKIKDINTLKHKKYVFLSLFVNMENIFKALTIFEKNEMLHFDLKTMNIMINGKLGNYKFNIIDFGYTSKIKDIIKKYPERGRFGYYVYPIDLMFISDKLFKELGNINRDRHRPDYVKYYIHNKIISNVKLLKSRTLGNLMKKTKHNDFFVPDETKIEFYTTKINNIFIIKDKRKQQKEIIKFKQEILEKLDVYSMGIVLYDLWINFIGGIFSLNKSNIKFIMEKIQKLIISMLQPYMHRYNPTEAYEEYMEIKNYILKNTILYTL